MGALKQKMMELEEMNIEDLEPTEIDLKKDMLTHTLEVTVSDLLHLDVSPDQILRIVEAVISKGFPAKLEGLSALREALKPDSQLFTDAAKAWAEYNANSPLKEL